MSPLEWRASPNAHLLIGELPAQRQLDGRPWEGTWISIAAHTALFIVLVYAGTHAPQMLATVTPMAGWSPEFLNRPGPESGGRSGGANTAQPARPAHVAEMPPREIAAMPNPLDTISAPISVPYVTAEAVQTLPGALSEIDGTSLGRGSGPGGGGADGPGMGNGRGPGAGDGDALLPGNGVTTPELLREVKPQYTVNAMRAKLQGAVELEAVVLPDGSVDPRRIRITRSLDRAMGLDEQAILAVRQWQFRPGMLRGRPVSVRVIVELTFTLR